MAIYHVLEHDAAGKLIAETLVRASHQVVAIRHAAQGRFTAKPVKTDDAIRLATKGVTVSEAGSE